MAYTLITDLPEEHARRESPLTSSAAAWADRRAELEGRDELRAHSDRMRRRWAINTGLIEGLYSIDRGVTQLLIDRGLHTDLISHGDSDVPAQQLMAHLHDQAEVYDWLYEFVAQERPFGTSWIKELHQLLTRHQDTVEAVDSLGNLVTVALERGTWKTLPNNPTRPDGTVHEYAPPELVPSEMDQLVKWHCQHLEAGVAAEVASAWLHHRFTKIHPFQDGNGRVARAIASLVLIRDQRFPLTVAPNDKSAYIGALEDADEGDLLPLIDFIEAEQAAEFRRALAIAEELADQAAIFQAGFAKARRAREVLVASYDDARVIASALMDSAEEDLGRRRTEFNSQAKRNGVESDHHAHLFRPPEEKRHYYRLQIETVARDCGYYANLQEFRDWVRLTIVDDLAGRSYLLLVSIHASGRSWKGTMTGLALLQVVDRGSDEDDRSDPAPAAAAPFDFGYLDVKEHVVMRFRDWLNDGWLSLLKQWEDGL